MNQKATQTATVTFPREIDALALYTVNLRSYVCECSALALNTVN